MALVVCFSTATAAYTKRAPFYNAWPTQIFSLADSQMIFSGSCDCPATSSLTAASVFERLVTHDCRVRPMGLRHVRQCRSGGIGRRAWFRSMYSQGCGGSSPPFGTNTIFSNSLQRLLLAVLLFAGNNLVRLALAGDHWSSTTSATPRSHRNF